MKLVYLEWCDAVASAPEWSARSVVDEWGKNTEWVIRECGWVVEETKEYIVIASCWKPEDELMEEQFKHLMKIPKTWVKRRVDLTKAVTAPPQGKRKV